MRYMMDCYARGNVADWAIELKSLGEVIGSIGVVNVQPKADAVEVGYCIGSRWWNQGITTEAFRAVIHYFFTEAGVNRVSAFHDTRNGASGAVMRKCGLTYEGTQRQASWNHSGLCDLDGYSILKEDWKS